MASTALHLSLECRFGAIWKAPLLLALGWKPLFSPVRPGLQISLWPVALWYGLIRPKWIKVGTKPVAPEPLTYALVGGPPRDWRGLKIFDLDTAAEITEVVEVDTANGWVIRYVTDDRGQVVQNQHGDRAKTEIIRGRFEIRRPD